jgi:hypothetical protein
MDTMRETGTDGERPSVVEQEDGFPILLKWFANEQTIGSDQCRRRANRGRVMPMPAIPAIARRKSVLASGTVTAFEIAKTPAVVWPTVPGLLALNETLSIVFIASVAMGTS